MKRPHDRALACLFLAVIWFISPAHAAQYQRFEIPLKLRSEVEKQPNRFAVSLPVAVSAATHGDWTQETGWAIWRYTADVPGATSMSFHAAVFRLPRNGVLTVRSESGVTYRYGSIDADRGELWSRIALGQRLLLELRVPTAARNEARLVIDAWQAGVRLLDDGNRKSALGALQQFSSIPSCVQNFDCRVDPAVRSAGQATVALIIGNVGQCTGVLVNNARGDATPYVLTARHCQVGALSRSDPSSASRVAVYWNAVSPCAQSLGTLYDPSLPRQTGAITRVEQQDAWLIQLDQSPIVDNAFMAGWSGVNRVIVGGYTPHHAAGLHRQYTEWFGSAFSSTNDANTPPTNYTANYLSVVNGLGTAGPGASGASLFDSSHRIAGVLSIGRRIIDNSGFSVCPASPLAEPNSSNEIARFTSFASIFDSTADTSSSTGPTTMRRVLDPDNSGRLSIDGIHAPPSLNLRASESAPVIDRTISLTWNTGAQTCTATDGASGDGWAGSVATSGTKSIQRSSAGLVSYGLTCVFSDGRVGRGVAAVDWKLPQPTATLAALSMRAWATRPVTLVWFANVKPCSLRGGSTNLTGLDSTGRVAVTEPTPAIVSYTLTCNDGTRQTDASTPVSFVAPIITFFANNAEDIVAPPVEVRRQDFLFLSWSTAADTCLPYGGAPSDGWSNQTLLPASGVTLANIPIGTYTYGITCTSGPLSVNKEVQVRITDNPPQSSLQLSASSAIVGSNVTATWVGNTSCALLLDPPLSYVTTASPGHQGRIQFSAGSSGSYIVRLRCPVPTGTDIVLSSPIEFTALPAPTINISPTSVTVGQTYTVAWSSVNTSFCTPLGGEGTVWTGQKPPSGSQVFTAASAGSYTYEITCVLNPSTSATSRAQIVIANAVTPPASGGGSSGGGGGTVAWLELLILVGILRSRWRRDVKLLDRSPTPPKAPNRNHY